MFYVKRDEFGHVVAKVTSDVPIEGMVEATEEEFGKADFTPLSDPPRVYTGAEALDAMSEDQLRKGRWKDALRIAQADNARDMKSKFKRIAEANGISVAELVPGIPLD